MEVLPKRKGKNRFAEWIGSNVLPMTSVLAYKPNYGDSTANNTILTLGNPMFIALR